MPRHETIVMFDELSSKDPKVKYGAAKTLLSLARTNPAEVYPQRDYLVTLLDSENNILKWTAIDVIGCLACVDKDKNVADVTGRLVAFLNSGKMITANHAVSALAHFAEAYPEQREAITEELLKVEHYTYDTEECRNIAMGNVITAIGPYFPALQNKHNVLRFARRQANNSRHATAKKAQAFLKKYSSERRLPLPRV